MIEVVTRSAKAMRTGDSLGRFGGEEFLLILAGAGAEVAQPALERVRRAVSVSPILTGTHRANVTVSIGGAVWTGQSLDCLISAADDALYAAKRNGRDCTVLAPLPELAMALR